MLEIERKYLVNEKWHAPESGGEYYRTRGGCGEYVKDEPISAHRKNTLQG